MTSKAHDNACAPAMGQHIPDAWINLIRRSGIDSLFGEELGVPSGFPAGSTLISLMDV